MMALSQALSVTGSRILRLRQDLLGQLFRDPAAIAMKVSQVKAEMPDLDLSSVLHASPNLVFLVNALPCNVSEQLQFKVNMRATSLGKESD